MRFDMMRIMISSHYSVIFFGSTFKVNRPYFLLNRIGEYPMRHPVVMGNWKLNGSKEMVVDLLNGLNAELEGVTGVDVAVSTTGTIHRSSRTYTNGCGQRNHPWRSKH